jgi:hypothetical protein
MTDETKAPTKVGQAAALGYNNDTEHLKDVETLGYASTKSQQQ